MKRLIGFAIGVVWLGLAFLALQRSLAGWSGGHSDIGFWWGVIALLLAIAGLGAAGGTYLHTRAREH